FIDALLDLTPADAEAAARMRRRAADFGLDAAAAHRLVVVALDRDVEDGASELQTLGDALARADRPLPRRPTAAVRETSGAQAIVASRRGRIVVLLATAGGVPAALGEALDGLAPNAWLAVVTEPVAGLMHLAETYASAIGALAVAARLG